MTTTVFFVRHGSHDRLPHTLCGRMAGVSLSATGLAEARRTAARLAGERLAAVYSSPLERARETAAVVAQAVDLPVAPVEELIELDYGEWTASTFDALDQDPRWAVWNRAKGVGRPPGGESLVELQARMRRFVDRACAEHPEQSIAAVSHSEPIKAILAHVMGAPLDNLDRFDVSPASVSILAAGAWGMKVFSINEAPR